jgi:hypothetical protein
MIRSTAKSAFMKFIRRDQIDISAVEHRDISHHWLIIFYLFTGFYDSWCCSRKARRSESSYACRSQELGHSDSPLVDVRLVRLSMFWDPKTNQLGPKPLLQWSSIFWILSDPCHHFLGPSALNMINHDKPTILSDDFGTHPCLCLGLPHTHHVHRGQVRNRPNVRESPRQGHGLLMFSPFSSVKNGMMVGSHLVPYKLYYIYYIYNVL